MTATEAAGYVPENAPQHCPGVESEKAGQADACQGCPNQKECAAAPKGPDPDLVAIEERMRSIKHKILVLSGKGGVGKSTFSAQLAFALARQGKEVGLLDIDICGPSIPRMLGKEGEEIHQSGSGWSPVFVEDNLAVMSIGFMLSNKNDPVIWRGPRKNSLIKQFLKDVDWGEMDYLVVDAPPGTSDEHISIAQYLKASQVDGAVIVTTPQEVSLLDVRKEINFCKKVGINVLGVVENMSELKESVAAMEFVVNDKSKGGETDVSEAAIRLLTEHFGQNISVKKDLFPRSSGGASQMSKEMGVAFLGKIPMDPSLCRAAEEGREFLETQSACHAALQEIVSKLRGACKDPQNGFANGKLDSKENGLHGMEIDPLLGSRIHLGF